MLARELVEWGRYFVEVRMLLLNSLADRGYKARTNSASVIPAMICDRHQPTPLIPHSVLTLRKPFPLALVLVMLY